MQVDVAVPALPSVHVVPGVNAPSPLVESVTAPCGELGLAAVSLTVTVQLVDAAAGSDVGVQASAVVVVSGPATVSVAEPLLALSVVVAA